MENNSSGQETNSINTPTIYQTDNFEISVPTLSAERNPRNLFFTCFLFFALIILNLENKFESNGSIVTSSTVSSSAFYFGEFQLISGLMNINEQLSNGDYLYTDVGSFPVIHGSSRWQFDWTKSSNISKSAWVSLFIQLDKDGKTYNWNFEKITNTDKSNIVFEGKTTEVPISQISNTNFTGCLLEIDVSNDTNLINQMFPQKENGSYKFRGNIVNEKEQRSNQVEYLIKSLDCNFKVLLTGAPFSMSLFRINIIHFSFLYNLKVLMEIRGSVTQLLHSNSPIFGPNHVRNTSISCLIMQVILDLLESIFILHCSFTLPSLLFSSFTLMILFKWIHIFYVQVRYIFWIWKSNYLQNIPVNEMPAAVSQFYRRLYLFLFGTIFFFILLFRICDSGEIFSAITKVSNQENKTFTQSMPYCIYLSLFLFLVPQIVNDAFVNISSSSNSSLPLHPHFILTSLIGKAFVPIYIWGYSNSIFNAPIFRHSSNMPISTKNSPLLSIFIFSIVLIQAILYFFQLKFGSKSLIPKIFRPKPYNYFRLTNKDTYSEIIAENTAEAIISTANDVRHEYINDMGTQQIQSEISNMQSSELDEIELTDFNDNRRYNNICVICMVNISIFNDFDHELCAVCTPCDHIFHQKCLRKWMNVKLECPTCRRPIPPFDIKQ